MFGKQTKRAAPLYEVASVPRFTALWRAYSPASGEGFRAERAQGAVFALSFKAAASIGVSGSVLSFTKST